jgi:hypothetical protein
VVADERAVVAVSGRGGHDDLVALAALGRMIVELVTGDTPVADVVDQLTVRRPV